ncbi:MAG: hypothetical protein GF350_05020 [Chitinivibrionales bacterium]|nr:hypothetical protein [Chitinivibrionales bacterium]
MIRIRKISILVIIFFMLGTFFSLVLCQESEVVPPRTKVITGTVRHFSEEGGFYGIEGDDGENYKPVNLSASFQRDGLKVKIMARIIRGKLLTQGWGTPVEILDIEARR